MNVAQRTTEYTEKLRQALQRDTTLRQLAAQATTRYAGEKARIDKGLTIAINHGVTFAPDGTALVKSQSDAEVVYEVKAGRCDCPDAESAPEFRCKHRWAACFTKRTQAQLPKPMTYYATYTAPDGRVYQGTAHHLCTQQWYFVVEATGLALYAEESGLVLGGHTATADAKRAEEEAAGGLAWLVCNHNGARRN